MDRRFRTAPASTGRTSRSRTPTPLQGTYTAKLTVGVEVRHHDRSRCSTRPCSPTAAPLATTTAAWASTWPSRMACAFSGPARLTARPISRQVPTTSWNNTGFTYADTSLVVLAFENQGYKITANVAPTGHLREIRRSPRPQLRDQRTFASMRSAVTPDGDNPCVDLRGLRRAQNRPGDTGYTTALAILQPRRQRRARPGQHRSRRLHEWQDLRRDLAAPGQRADLGPERRYRRSARAAGITTSTAPVRADGSTIGWDMLALLDASAAGATVPAWVKTRVRHSVQRSRRHPEHRMGRSITPPTASRSRTATSGRRRTASAFRACS